MSETPPVGSSSPPNPSEANFRIDFIDPLFAVAIHIGFVEGLLKETWLEHHSFPSHFTDWANLCLFIAAFWTIAASWVGYHQSIRTKQIKDSPRFILDIVLLSLYILLLLYFSDPLAEALILATIYVVYIAWDFYKTREYPDKYYSNAPPPSGLAYVGNCFAEWLRPGAHPDLISEAVTLGWAVFFVILAPYATFSVSSSNVGKISFAAAFVIANTIYRYDKRTQGTWICSTPFKVLMGAIVGYFVLYYTKVLCF